MGCKTRECPDPIHDWADQMIEQAIIAMERKLASLGDPISYEDAVTFSLPVHVEGRCVRSLMGMLGAAEIHDALDNCFTGKPAEEEAKPCATCGGSRSVRVVPPINGWDWTFCPACAAPKPAEEKG